MTWHSPNTPKGSKRNTIQFCSSPKHPVRSKVQRVGKALSLGRLSNSEHLNPFSVLQGFSFPSIGLKSAERMQGSHIPMYSKVRILGNGEQAAMPWLTTLSSLMGHTFKSCCCSSVQSIKQMNDIFTQINRQATSTKAVLNLYNPTPPQTLLTPLSYDSQHCIRTARLTTISSAQNHKASTDNVPVKRRFYGPRKEKTARQFLIPRFSIHT